MCVSHVVVKYKKFFSTKILANFLYLYIYVIRCQISLNPPPSKCQKWSKPISHVRRITLGGGRIPGVHLPQMEQRVVPPLATGIHSSLSRSADLISRGSHERLQFGISFWLGRTSGLARVDGQYVLYMSAPALDVRRHISNLGRPATVFKVCKGRWWFR